MGNSAKVADLCYTVAIEVIEMKKTKVLLLSLVAVLALGLAACGNQSKSSNNDNQKSSFKNAPTSTSASDVKDTVQNSNILWYSAGSVNAKSKSGYEAFVFDKSTKHVTFYNVSKFYKSLSAAKSANALNKVGTVRYTFKTNSKNQTVIRFSGKLSDIPMTQTMTFTGTTKGTNKANKIDLSGYKVVRDVDYDKTNAVFVQAD